MEVLRQPVEDGTVTISRVSGTLTYPCSTMVVAAMNPCPCGYYGHPVRPCTCPPKASPNTSPISGPCSTAWTCIEVPPVDFEALSRLPPTPSPPQPSGSAWKPPAPSSGSATAAWTSPATRGWVPLCCVRSAP